MKHLIVLALLFVATGAPCKTLIISDIDDTLKNAHVLNKLDQYWHAFQTHRAFKGMPELFQLLQKQIPDAEFVYLSNASQSLMTYSHSSFLKKNGFPAGILYLRKNHYDKDFKLEKLREILKQQDPHTQTLFLGDNAERDIYFYSQVLKEYSLPNLTYIRTFYQQSDFKDHEILSLTDGQKGFITPLEILYDLYQNKIIQSLDWTAFSYLLSYQILSEDLTVDVAQEYFPSWLKCDVPPSIEALLTDKSIIVAHAAKRIKSVCEGP